MPARHRRPGFSLVELLVALVVLVLGMGTLAAGTARALRALADARLEEDAAVRAGRRFEALRATACPLRAGGEWRDARLVERWRVAAHAGGAATRLEVDVAPAARPADVRRYATVAPC